VPQGADSFLKPLAAARVSAIMGTNSLGDVANGMNPVRVLPEGEGMKTCPLQDDARGLRQQTLSHPQPTTHPCQGSPHVKSPAGGRARGGRPPAQSHSGPAPNKSG
jgi:hypothetical protein